MEFRDDRDQARISPRPGNDLVTDHILLSYKGGIDGTGMLAAAHNNKRVHSEALVRNEDVQNATFLDVPASVVDQYRKSQEVLADDSRGHLSGGHPLSKQFRSEIGRLKEAIQRSADFAVNQTDYNLWRQNFGAATQPAIDGNSNGMVDAADYVIWREQLGRVGAGLHTATLRDIWAKEAARMSAITLHSIRRRPAHNTPHRIILTICCWRIDV